MPLEDFPALTDSDRCDGCPARAVTPVLVDNDLPLLYLCGYHLRKHRSYMDEKGYSYVMNDYIRRDVLFELPPLSHDANKPYAGVD